MQQYRARGLLLALFAVLSFVGHSAFGSEFIAPAKDGRWRQSTITISVSRSIETSPNIQGSVLEALGTSVRQWSAEANIRIQVVETVVQSVSPKGIKGDGISLVSAAMTAENVALFPKQALSPTAVTRVFRDSRGNITEADIILNPFVRFSTDGNFDTYDLQDTLTHEVGHLLGLGHSPIWGSIMYSRSARSLGPASYSGSRKNLPRVDAASIMAIYGQNPSSPIACCDVVSGRISGIGASVEPLVWLEDRQTGRVVAASTIATDGTYRIEGVPEGEYDILAAAHLGDRIVTGKSSVKVDFERETTAKFSAKAQPAGFRASLLGTSPQLAQLPVKLTERTPFLFLGTDNQLSENLSRIGISGTSIIFERVPGISYSMGGAIRALGFAFDSGSGLQSGEYTLVIEDNAGVRQFLVAALIVD